MKRGGKSRQGVYWGLVAVALALLGWVWWQGANGTKPPIVKPLDLRPVASKPSPTNAPPPPPAIPVTNAPPPVIAAKTSMPPLSIVMTNLVSGVATNVAPSLEKILEAQVALVRHGISVGSLDGLMGYQTRAALRAFQQKESLPVTGALNALTLARFFDLGPSLTECTVSAEDLTRLRPLSKSWLGKSQQDRLDFETVLELIAEKGQAHPNLVRRLNPDINWSNVLAGTVVKLPNVEFPPVTQKAAYVKIFLAARSLQAFDAEKRLLAHFPCSIAQRVEKRPLGELRVAVAVLNPNYTFNPEVFPESAEARQLGRKLILPPGPNNPVGVAWIGLDRPGYGIHGTPRPEDVGRTESHGCFRLANWNAEFLFRLVAVGTPILVEP